MLSRNIQFMLISFLILITSYGFSRYIYYNPSSSEPIGYYFAYRAGDYHSGDLVLMCLNKQPWVNVAFKLGLPIDDTCSNHTPYLLKQIVAAPGDRILINNKGIHINGKYLPDSLGLNSYKGVLLYPQQSGAQLKLTANQFFVLGHSRFSYDSRYFGVISRADINYKALPIWH